MGSQEGKQECSDFIKQFFTKDIIQGAFKGLCTVSTQEDGKKETLIKNKFFKEDEQAISYGNPLLFFYLARLFINQQPGFLGQHPALLSDVLTLSLSYSIHYAAVQSSLQEKFLHLAMEVIYFTKENLGTFSLSTIENLTQNTLLLHVAESLKNEKKNDKIEECQRLITEMYVQLMLIKEKAVQIKQQQIKQSAMKTKQQMRQRDEEEEEEDED